MIFLGEKADLLIKKFMVLFLLLTISAAGYCGFFVKWAFREDSPRMGFTAMIEMTAVRPFVHRQLLPQTAKAIASVVPDHTKERLSERLTKDPSIEKRYAQAQIPRQYIIEYYVLYIICFLGFFAAVCVLRSLLCEIVEDKVAGTLGAMFFALIFPFFEVLGGYFYDIYEVLFMFLAARFALHGKWWAVLVLAPIATSNKESFFFFLATLFPLTCRHHGFKKSAIITLGTVFVAGLTYLYIRQMFAGNPGGMADWRIKDHLEIMFNPMAYFKTSSIYGLPMGSGMFLPHMICVLWIARRAWGHLSEAWKNHAKIALFINGVLYFMFVLPDEIRDLSMLYVTFMVLVTFYIRDVVRGDGADAATKKIQ